MSAITDVYVGPFTRPNAEGQFVIDEGVALPGHQGVKVERGHTYSDEYKRGYLSAHKRVSVVTFDQRQREKHRPGRTGFIEGWRDYFREHC